MTISTHQKLAVWVMASSNLSANTFCCRLANCPSDPEANADLEDWMAEILHSAVQACYQIAPPHPSDLEGQRLMMQVYVDGLLGWYYWPESLDRITTCACCVVGRCALRSWPGSACSCGFASMCMNLGRAHARSGDKAAIAAPAGRQGWVSPECSGRH